MHARCERQAIRASFSRHLGPPSHSTNIILLIGRRLLGSYAYRNLYPSSDSSGSGQRPQQAGSKPLTALGSLPLSPTRAARRCAACRPRRGVRPPAGGWIRPGLWIQQNTAVSGSSLDTVDTYLPCRTVVFSNSLTYVGAQIQKFFFFLL